MAHQEKPSYTSVRVLALVGMLALSAAGCVHEGAYVARSHRNYDVPLNNVGIADKNLAWALAIENQGSARSAANKLEVWVEVRNRADRQQGISLRTRFYNKGRQPIESTQWTRMFIDARSLTTYHSLATRPDAAYYYVEIQEGM